MGIDRTIGTLDLHKDSINLCITRYKDAIIFEKILESPFQNFSGPQNVIMVDIILEGEAYLKEKTYKKGEKAVRREGSCKKKKL